VSVVALAAGIGLRLWRPDLAQANFDEANVASLVGAWKYQGAFPLAGTVSSYGFRAGQGWPWLAALGLLWTDDPYALLGTGLAAGICGLVACWWVARRWLGAWGGAAAALFNATAFYCVLLDRGAWLPVFLQAPMALCLDAILRLAVQRRPWALVVACGWLGVLVSLHYTAVAFAIVVAVAMWHARSGLRPGHVAAALVAGILPLTPLLVHEVNATVHLRDLSDLLGLSGGGASVDLDTVVSTVQVASTQGAAGLGGHAAGDLAAALGRGTSLSLLGPVLAAAGLVVAIMRRPGGATGWLLAAWTLAPILAFVRHGAPVIFHYMYIEFPGLALATGALAAWAANSRFRAVRAGVALAIGTYACASALSMLVLLGALDRLDMSAGYGVPVGYSREAGRVARGFLPAGGQVLIGDDPHSAEVLRFSLGYSVPSRSFEDCREVPIEANAIYLLASERTPGATALDSAGARLLARIARPGGDAYRVYAAPPTAASLEVRAQPSNPICQDRLVWDGP
jgi:hypothetical protein